jgi:dGTPase
MQLVSDDWKNRTGKIHGDFYLPNAEIKYDKIGTKGDFSSDELKVISSKAFRRLSQKTQVYIFSDDHRRTRLTHSIEVASIARLIAQNLNLNQQLAWISGLAHDFGHGPGGHASEDAFSELLNGWHHADFSKELAISLNLSEPIIDAVHCHSWNKPEPHTQEGACVRIADRIAYVLHDLDDAIDANVIKKTDLPPEFNWIIDITLAEAISIITDDIVQATKKSGVICLSASMGQFIDNLRSWLYDNVYTSSQTKITAETVRISIKKLVNTLASTKELTPKIVRWIAKITDRYFLVLVAKYYPEHYEQLLKALELKPPYLPEIHLNDNKKFYSPSCPLSLPDMLEI